MQKTTFKISFLPFSLFQFLFFISLKAQVNLVPNPSFESYIVCPNSFGQASACTGWQSFRSSPEYFNGCSTYSSGLSVPKNDAGYQVAADGIGYMGLICFASSSEGDFEALGAQLVSPLSVGLKYFVSLKITLASKDPIWSNSASDHMGIMFSKNAFSVSNPKPLDNSAKVYSNSIIQDTLNWTLISGSFVADSAYNYIIIGNFFNTANTNTVSFFSSSQYGSYYYIDDVRLSTDSFFVNYNVQENHIGSSTYAFPNPFSSSITIPVKKSIVILYLYDCQGKVIFSRNIKDASFFQMETEELPSGVYYLLIKDFSQQTILKQKIQKL